MYFNDKKIHFKEAPLYLYPLFKIITIFFKRSIEIEQKVVFIYFELNIKITK